MNALITANIGGIDEIKRPVHQLTVLTDYFEYSDRNLPYPLPNLTDRMKGKYLKINSHRFLEKYGNYIWMDGRVEVISPDFVKMISGYLENYDVVIGEHYSRRTVFEEISFIKTMMAEGNEYLLARYRNEPFEDEAEFYKSEGLPIDFPVYACTVFGRKNSIYTNAAFTEWWMRTLEYTCFDQCMFSYIVWKYRLKVKVITRQEMLKYIVIGKHKLVK